MKTGDLLGFWNSGCVSYFTYVYFFCSYSCVYEKNILKMIQIGYTIYSKINKHLAFKNYFLQFVNYMKYLSALLYGIALCSQECSHGAVPPPLFEKLRELDLSPYISFQFLRCADAVIVTCGRCNGPGSWGWTPVPLHNSCMTLEK